MTKDDGGPALCARCPEIASHYQGHQWLCPKHYRFGQMRATAKRSKKAVPSYPHLEKMHTEQNGRCPDCGRPMNWLGRDRQTTVATLQHYRDGSLAIVCRSCNTRHASMPGDEYRDIPNEHKYCPHCKVVKPFCEFSADNGRSGPMKLKSWCKTCSSIANKEWRSRHVSA